MQVDACSTGNSLICCFTACVAMLMSVICSVVFGRHDSEVVGLSRLRMC